MFVFLKMSISMIAKGVARIVEPLLQRAVSSAQGSGKIALGYPPDAQRKTCQQRTEGAKIQPGVQNRGGDESLKKGLTKPKRVPGRKGKALNSESLARCNRERSARMHGISGQRPLL
jgi:hypothetical protein